MGKVTQIGRLAHWRPHLVFWGTQDGVVGDSGQAMRGSDIPVGDACRSWVEGGTGLMLLTKWTWDFPKSRWRADPPSSTPCSTLAVVGSALSHPLPHSSASPILSALRHAERNSRGLGRPCPAILHSVRAQCSHYLEQREVSRSWQGVGDHARPLLSPRAAQQLSLGPRLFVHTTSRVPLGKSQRSKQISILP